MTVTITHGLNFLKELDAEVHGHWLDPNQYHRSPLNQTLAILLW